MEKIELQGLEELKAKENLPEVPELVQKYLDLEKKVTQGNSFRIVINQKSNPVSGHGIAYSNELQIQKRGSDGCWIETYNTGMIQYRGAYASDIDNWDLSLNNPAILEESDNEVIYGLQTGDGNIKIYHLQEGFPKIICSFNVRDYKKTQERIELLRNVVNDARAYVNYTKRGLGKGWRVHQNHENDKETVILLLAEHADRPYDALTDKYKLHVWVKNKGIAVLGHYRTNLSHPRFKKNYRIRVYFEEVEIKFSGEILELSLEFYNDSQGWRERREFRIKL